MSRHLRSTRAILVTGAAWLVLCLSACGGPSSSLPSTTLGKVVAATFVYPPIPPPAPGKPQGCLGRTGTGMTTPQVQQVIEHVSSMTRSGQANGVGACPGGPALVGLNPGEESVAHRLWARYGSRVAITVGLTSYDGHPGRSPLCGALEPSMPLPGGLHLALQLDSRRVRSGSTFDATAVVSERGPDSYVMDTGEPIEAVVVRPGSLRVVGVFSGGIGGTGAELHVAPGAMGTIPVVGGTARCDGGIGSALPPGRYQVIARVAPESSPHFPYYLTDPVALRVTGS